MPATPVEEALAEVSKHAWLYYYMNYTILLLTKQYYQVLGSIPAQSVVSGGTLPPAQPLPAGPNLYAAPPPRHWGTPSLQPPPTLAPPHPAHPLYTTTAPVYHGALVGTAVSAAAQGSNGPVPTTGAPSSGAGIPILPGTSAGVPTSPPGAATTGLPPSIPPVPGAVNTTNGSNDLFVHVQPGETISLAVGSEVQHIMGTYCGASCFGCMEIWDLPTSETFRPCNDSHDWTLRLAAPCPAPSRPSRSYHPTNC